jgi:hypothetical protein
MSIERSNGKLAQRLLLCVQTVAMAVRCLPVPSVARIYGPRLRYRIWDSHMAIRHR